MHSISTHTHTPHTSTDTIGKLLRWESYLLPESVLQIKDMETAALISSSRWQYNFELFSELGGENLKTNILGKKCIVIHFPGIQYAALLTRIQHWRGTILCVCVFFKG